MDRMVLLLFSQLWLLGAMSQGKLIYFQNSKGFYAAQAYCRQQDADLITIRSEADYAGIVEDTWLGVHRENQDAVFKWSQGDEPLTYIPPWEKGYPEDGKHCVLFEKGKTHWKSEDCASGKTFYCVQETLRFVNETKTWEEALEHCRGLEGSDPAANNVHIYDLAPLLTDEDHQIATDLIQTAVWTGLRFLGDQWMWVTGEEVQYSDINNCPSVDHCGALDRNSIPHYIISKCDEKKSFLCSKRPADG